MGCEVVGVMASAGELSIKVVPDLSAFVDRLIDHILVCFGVEVPGRHALPDVDAEVMWERWWSRHDTMVVALDWSGFYRWSRDGHVEDI